MSRSWRTASCRSCTSNARRAADSSATSIPDAWCGCSPACNPRSSRSDSSAPHFFTSPTSGRSARTASRPRRRARSSGSSPRDSRSWCRWSRTRSAARARGSRPRSRSPGACSSICRRTRTSVSRSGSRTRPAGSCCAKSCSSSSAPTSAAASSSAPSPSRPPRPISRTTSHTCAGCGAISASAPRRRTRPPCSIRISRSPSACCATSSTRRPGGSWSTRAKTS